MEYIGLGSSVSDVVEDNVKSTVEFWVIEDVSAIPGSTYIKKTVRCLVGPVMDINPLIIDS